MNGRQWNGNSGHVVKISDDFLQIEDERVLIAELDGDRTTSIFTLIFAVYNLWPQHSSGSMITQSVQ